MDRETFDRILTEEGTDEGRLRGDAKQFKRVLLGLQVRKALNDAIDREYGRDK